MKSSFTLLELLVVIVIIGIIVSTLSFNFSPNQLQLAANQIISDIRFTQSLALKDDKYQPFPNNITSKEENRSKYWFKQWWQFKFATDSNDIIYYVFSDKPANTSSNNFDNKIIQSSHKQELAKYSDGKYIYGGDTYLYTNERPNIDCNLSHYGIKLVKLIIGNKTIKNGKIHLLFDANGNIFLDEGKSGDAEDINPLDKSNRKLITKNASIQICLDNPCKKIKNRCIQINITPSGNLYKSKCD